MKTMRSFLYALYCVALLDLVQSSYIACERSIDGSRSVWDISIVDSLVKVFPDGSKAGATGIPKQVSFSALSNQEVALYLAISRADGSTAVPDRVEATNVRTAGGTGRSPLVQGSLWFGVGYVHVPIPSNPENLTGWFPDPLTPIVSGYTSLANNSAYKAIEGQSTWPIWVRLKAAAVSQDSSGELAFDVTFQESGDGARDGAGSQVKCSTDAIPVPIRVITQPIGTSKAAPRNDPQGAPQKLDADSPELHQLTDCHSQGVALEYAQPGQFKGNTTGSFMHAIQAMTSHGVNSLEYQDDWWPVPKATLAGGDCSTLTPHYSINLTLYFAQMQEVLATSSVRRFHFPLPVSLHHETHYVTTNATAFFWTEGPQAGVCHIPLLQSLPDGSVALTEQYKAHWRTLATALWSQLKEQPWFSSITYSYFVVDEPEWNDNTTALATLQMMQLATETLGDDIRIWQDRWPVVPVAPQDPKVMAQLVKTVDTWCVHVNYWSTPGVPLQLAGLRKAGKTITIYDNGMLFVDMPWPRIRLQAWMVWRTDSGVDEGWNGVPKGQGLRGTLSWYDANDWRNSEGRYGNPWYGLPLYHNSSGFGVQLYPPLRSDSVPPSMSSEAAGVAVLPSIRHEHLWLGIQDAEALYLLQEKQEGAVKYDSLASSKGSAGDGAVLGGPASGIPQEVLSTVWNFTVQWNAQHLKPPIPNDGYTINVTLIREAQQKVAVRLADYDELFYGSF